MKSTGFYNELLERLNLLPRWKFYLNPSQIAFTDLNRQKASLVQLFLRQNKVQD